MGSRGCTIHKESIVRDCFNEFLQSSCHSIAIAYPEVCVFDNGYHGNDIILSEHWLDGKVIVSIQQLHT